MLYLILISLISYVCKDSYSKEGHIHRFWNISFLGEPSTRGSLLFTVSAPLHILPFSRPSLHPVTQNGCPSASGARELVSSPLSRPPLHPLTQNGGPSSSTHTEWRPLFIHSHRMAAPPLLERVSSSPRHSPARHFIHSHRMAAPPLLERVSSSPRHSPARHFIYSHRMAAPPLLERVSSSPHTPSPSFAWYSSHPESCGSLSHSLRTLLSCHFPREVSP